MARVEYASREPDDRELAPLFEAQRRLGGRVTNFHRILGRLPGLYRWWIPFSAAVRRSHTDLPRRLRLLAEIRASIVNSCEYCATHTSTMGRKVGITDEELDALQAGDPDVWAAHFTAEEQAVIRWATAVAGNTARRDSAAFDALRAHLDEPQVIELTVLIATRTLLNRVQEALWTDLEGPDEVEEPRPGPPASDIDGYVRDLLCPGGH